MKVLVTGAAGLIGNYLSRQLIWRGDDVVGIDNFDDYYPRNCKEFNVDLINLAAVRNTQFFPKKSVLPIYEKLSTYYKNIVPENKRGNFQFYELDVRDVDGINQLFEKQKFDKVVHLAAMAGVPFSTKFPAMYTQVNVDGTTNVLTASKDNGVKKFVFASTASVYGSEELTTVKETDSVMRANSNYGATKVAGEVLCYAFYNLYGLKTASVRIFGPIYGPLQRPKGMFMQRIINFIRNKKTLQIYGRQGLETAKDTTYIDDEVDGIILIMDADLKAYDVFNIGTSSPYPIKDWIRAAEDAYGEKVKVEIIEVDKADTTSSADISKARKLLGYNPKVDIFEGAKRQVEVFKLMPEWYQTLSDV